MTSFLDSKNIGNLTQADANHLVKENTKLQQQVAERGEKIQRLAKALSSAHADVSKSVTSVARYEELQADLKELGEEKAQLSKKVATLEDTLHDQQKSHEVEIERRERDSSTLKEKLDLETKRASKATAAKDALEKELSAAKDHISALQKAASDDKQQYDKLQKNYKALSSEKAQLDTKTEQFRALIVDNDRTLKQQKAQINSLNSDKHALQTDLSIVNSENKDLKAKLDSLAASGVEKDKTIKYLRSTVKQLEDDKGRETAKVEQLAKDLAAVSENRDKAWSEVSCLNHWLKETRENMVEKQEESSRQIASLESSLKETCQQKDILESNLEAAHKQLEATRSEVSSLREHTQQLQLQLTEAKEKLSAVDGSEMIVLPDIGKIETFSENYF